MSLYGTWKAHGYGWVLNISPQGYSLYDYTDISCVEFERGESRQFELSFDRIEQKNPDHLSLYVRNEITRYDFGRISSLPDEVLALDKPRKPDPEYNFEVFWKTFDQDYAFFERRGINWHALYEQHRNHIDNNTGDEALFNIFKKMLEPLQDNHVKLSNHMDHYVSDKTGDIVRQLIDTFKLETATLGNNRTVDIYKNYVIDELLEGNCRVAGNSLFIWGRVEENIAYIAVLRLYGLTGERSGQTTVFPNLRHELAAMLANDLDEIQNIMDDVMHDMRSADAIIMDIRINGGGFDRVAMAIANRFADKERLAFSKSAHTRQSTLPEQAIYVRPEGDFQFTGPVYLLTSRRTASAGEILALCMMVLPNVTRVGETTTGILSDDHIKHLPNGWNVYISNEVYTAADGNVYEEKGIPPEIEIPVFLGTDLKKDLKIAIEEVKSIVRNKK